MMELITPTSGRNKGVTRAEIVADPSPGLMAQRIHEQRPGEEQLLDLIRKPLGH